MQAPQKSGSLKWLWVAGAVIVLAGIGGAFLQDRASNYLLTKRRYRIPSASMLPTLPINSIHLVDLAAYRDAKPKVDDIVVFDPPASALLHGQEGVQFIMRIVGVEGDVIEIRDGSMHRSGTKVSETYIAEPYFGSFKLGQIGEKVIPIVVDSSGEVNGPASNVIDEFRIDDSESATAIKAKPAAIPRGKILVMGDNRNYAFDGRHWGLIAVEAVLGRLILSQ